MTRRGAQLAPVRTCAGCGQRDAQAGLVRLRRAEAGRLVESDGRGHGRSAYVHRREACVARLARSRWLERSLRAKVAAEARADLAGRLLADGRDDEGNGRRIGEGVRAPGARG